MPNYTCYAYATEYATGDLIEGTAVSIRMAFDEHWVQKDGSKWPTMPKQMLKYRAAAFFGRTYAPDVMQGMYTRDEIEDIGNVTDSEVVSTTINQPRKVVSFDEKKLIEDGDGVGDRHDDEKPAVAPQSEPAQAEEKPSSEAPY